MRRILLIGRSESGKTTLKQVLRGENITYKKTQYVSQYDCVIDMPGEYAENLDLAHTIDLYAAESDVVGIVLSATEPYSLYPPKLTGCKKIFFTSAYTGEGIEEIFEFLREEHDICPVEKVMDALHKESFGKQAELPHYHLQ